MDLHTLVNTPGARHRRKRLGHGESSGRGKTSGRGNKGQMARKGSSHKLGFEGGQMRLIRRLPKRGFHNPSPTEYIPVNVGALSRFEEGTEVTPALLRSSGLAKGTLDGIKILAGGELNRKLTVTAAAFSASAKAKIEAVGGVCRIESN